MAEDNVEKMVLKAEEVNFEAEDNDYQDYTEGEMNDPFEDSTLQGHEEAETDNVPNDQFNESTHEDPDNIETSNATSDTKGRFIYVLLILFYRIHTYSQ